MDVIRHAYVSTMQFDAAGLITAKVRWYFAPPGALDFPSGHLFGSRVFRSDPKPVGGIGETADEVTTWDAGEAPTGVTGTGPFCGPLDWYVNGCPSNAPPLVISGTIPDCCGVFQCDPWRFPFIPNRVLVRELTGATWTRFFNQNSEADFREPVALLDHMRATYNPAAPCHGFGGTTMVVFINLGAFVQQVTLNFVSYDPIGASATWQVPVNPYRYSGEFFLFTNPIV